MAEEGTIIFTKNGRPLMRDGNDLFSETGTHVAQLDAEGKAYDLRGRYAGTIDQNDRLVYRMEDSATIGSIFTPQAHEPFQHDPGTRLVTLDEEPALQY
jgi:hypothetical protein